MKKGEKGYEEKLLRNRARYWKDPDAARAARRRTGRKWRAAHPGAARDASRAWREANPEKWAESQRRYRETHRGQENARARRGQRALRRERLIFRLAAALATVPKP